MTDRLELVTVFATGDLVALAVAKGVLESAGIPFLSQGEGLQDLVGVGRIGGMNLVSGPVRIQVRREDAQRALEVLDEDASVTETSSVSNGLVAKASVTIDASSADVWSALITPASIKQYFFGTNLASTWKEGSPITWKGEWQGNAYEDKGVVLRFQPERLLEYTHFSPLSGLPDAPEHYHTVTIELTAEGGRTRVVLSQDNNLTEQAREHSEKNWAMMLSALKRFVEG